MKRLIFAMCILTMTALAFGQEPVTAKPDAPKVSTAATVQDPDSIPLDAATKKQIEEWSAEAQKLEPAAQRYENLNLKISNAYQAFLIREKVDTNKYTFDPQKMALVKKKEEKAK